jgi:transposase-like protein
MSLPRLQYICSWLHVVQESRPFCKIMNSKTCPICSSKRGIKHTCEVCNRQLCRSCCKHFVALAQDPIHQGKHWLRSWNIKSTVMSIYGIFKAAWLPLTPAFIRWDRHAH